MLRLNADPSITPESRKPEGEQPLTTASAYQSCLSSWRCLCDTYYVVQQTSADSAHYLCHCGPVSPYLMYEHSARSRANAGTQSASCWRDAVLCSTTYLASGKSFEAMRVALRLNQRPFSRHSIAWGIACFKL